MKSPWTEIKCQRRRTPEECRRIVSDYLASGLSLWRFSQSVEFSYGSLRNWVKRYGSEAKKDQASSQSFVELPAFPIEQAGIAAPLIIEDVSPTESSRRSEEPAGIIRTIERQQSRSNSVHHFQYDLLDEFPVHQVR
jgi:transposase-like protein